MQSKQVKDKILQLVDLKNDTSEIIQKIYVESCDYQLSIYDDSSIFCENSKGFELIAKLLRKRPIVSDVKVKGKYPIKKYFIYNKVEIFCFYKDENAKSKRLQRKIGSIVSKIKSFASFIWGVITFIK